ncbi:MAG: hypothetical protein OEM52_01065 [bacterium]|nr:hypothetical protein [bacterium]
MNRSQEADDHLQFLKEMSFRDAGWQRILYNRLQEPLGFEPGPELRAVVPDSMDTPNSGNW